MTSLCTESDKVLLHKQFCKQNWSLPLLPVTSQQTIRHNEIGEYQIIFYNNSYKGRDFANSNHQRTTFTRYKRFHPDSLIQSEQLTNIHKSSIFAKNILHEKQMEKRFGKTSGRVCPMRQKSNHPDWSSRLEEVGKHT